MSSKADLDAIRDDIRKQILAHLETYSSSSISAYEMARKFKGVGTNTVRRICQELYEEGEIWRIETDPQHISWQFATAVPTLDKRQAVR